MSRIHAESVEIYTLLQSIDNLERKKQYIIELEEVCRGYRSGDDSNMTQIAKESVKNLAADPKCSDSAEMRDLAKLEIDNCLQDFERLEKQLLV